MNCCACNGSCNHVGPHSFCVAHGGQTFYGPTYVGAVTNLYPSPQLLQCLVHCRKHCPEHDGQATEETCTAAGCEYNRRQKAEVQPGPEHPRFETGYISPAIGYTTPDTTWSARLAEALARPKPILKPPPMYDDVYWVAVRHMESEGGTHYVDEAD